MVRALARFGISLLSNRKFYLSLFCGGVTLISDLIIIRLLIQVPTLTLSSVVTLAFLCAIVINFTLQRFFVFGKDHGVMHSFSLFFLYWIVMSVVNVLLVMFGVMLIGNVYVSQCVTTVLLSLMSFAAYQKFIFGGEKIFDRYPILRDRRVVTGALLFAFVFLIKVIVLILMYAYVGEDTVVWGDSLRYLGTAQSLIENGTFAFEGQREVYRTPGLPLILVPFLYFHISYVGIALMQAFLSTWIQIGVFALSLSLSLRTRWAVSAALLSGLEPLSLYYSLPILPDVVFAVLLYGACYFLYQYTQTRSVTYIVWLGIVVGFSNYVRQVGVYLVALFVLYILLHTLVARQSLKNASMNVGILFAIVLLSAFPWYYRNYQASGVWSFSSALPVNFYNYVGAGTLASARGVPYDTARTDLMATFRAEAPVPADETDLHNVGYLMSSTQSIVRAYPLSYIKTVIAGTNTFLFSGNYHYLLRKFGAMDGPEHVTSYSLVWAHEGLDGLISRVWQDMSPYVVIAIVGKLFWMSAVGLALLGAYLLRTREESHIFIILFVYFCATILSVGIGVEARHRYALNPLIFTFAFVTLERIYDTSKNYLSRRTRV